MSLTIRHPINGSDVVIENPLLQEHIQEGRLLWYWGFTSTGSWNCPAIITRVSKRLRGFRVRSLDDMREQRQWHPFSCRESSPTSRQTMRLASDEEVRNYLIDRRTELDRTLRDASHAQALAEEAIANFDKVRATLPL